MLNSNARKVLNFFISSKSNQNWTSIACKLNFTKDKSKDIKIIEQAIKDLEEENCIKYIPNVNCSYQLTNTGKMYFKTERRNKIQSVLNGVVFPIVVALITTLLTIYLAPYQSNKQSIEIQCNCKNDTKPNP